jgi:hypothetical protein
VLPSGSFAGDSTELLIRYGPEASVHAVRPDGSRNRLTSKAFGRLVKPEMHAPASSPQVIYDARRAETPAIPAFAGGLVGAQAKTPQPPMRLIEVCLPVDVLRRLELIEVRAFPEGRPSSPSAEAFRNVDLAVWCTLATQAWKETELAAWKRIPPGRRRRALMLVTYRDTIRREADEAKIMARLLHSSAALFSGVVILSLRDALQSLLSGDAEAAALLRAKSNIDAAEAAISALAEDRQRQRFRRASRLLARLVQRIGRKDPKAAVLSQRLSALSEEFLKASPSLFLTERAA